MNSKTLTAAILAAAIGSAALTAQSPTLLKDFNLDPNNDSYSGGSTYWAVLGGAGYLNCQTVIHGNELWKITPASAGLVGEIGVGESDYVGNPRHNITYNGNVYFTAWKSALGREIYKTDGTSITLLKDIMPGNPEGGPFTSGPLSFYVYNGELYFTADDGTNGRELWKTDGTSAGTVMVDDVAAGSADGMGNTTEYETAGGALFITSNGRLYRTFGLAAPGSIVEVDPLYSNCQYMAELGGNLILQADDGSGTYGAEVYKCDGTTFTLLSDSIPGAVGGRAWYCTKLGSKVFFYAQNETYTPSWSTTPRSANAELWETDGTAAGTLLHKDINTNINAANGYSESSYPSNLMEHAGTLYFTANDGNDGSYNTEL